MSPTRRDFLKAPPPRRRRSPCTGPSGPVAAQTLAAPAADPMALELANAALDAARSGGASYADVRVGRYRRQSIATREQQVLSVADNESYGLGVRVLVDGSWGFAATSRMTRRGAQQAALSALALSKAARAVRRRRVELAPTAPVRGTWITPVAPIRSRCRSRTRSHCCSRPTRRR